MKTITSFKTIRTLSAASALMIGSAFLATATPQMEPEGDIEVAEFIQMEIYHDSMMEGADVNLSIEGGIATLTGKARSLAQVERASAKVFANPEVLTVVNQLRISSSDPAGISSRATEMLANQKILDASRIQVISDGSRIVLEGDVSTTDEAELARELVSEVPGATYIENRLIIDFQSIRTDAQIAAQLAYAVNDDPVYAGLDLKPQVTDGVVKWDGQVGSRSEFNRLVRKSFVTGVIDVEVETLKVNSDLAMEAVEDKDYTPAQSLEALTVAIQHDSRLNSENIQLRMNQGVITLSGSVSSRKNSEAAELTARCIPGVLSVSNQLSISDHNKFASAPTVKP